MIQEGLKFFGLHEIVGKENSPVIMGWAKEFGISDIFLNDETAWCALAHAKVAKNAGKIVPYTRYELLRAASWVSFGKEVKEPEYGDTLVFHRPGGYHVGLYIAEDAKAFHVMGGNQSNAYNIIRIDKERLIAARRPVYNVQPESVKKYLVESDGKVSVNER